MLKLGSHLALERCPHCGVDRPNLAMCAAGAFLSTNAVGQDKIWCTYRCNRCGEIVLASARVIEGPVLGVYPATLEVDSAIPATAREYLRQAINSQNNSPAASIMVCASSVDAMLKALDYKDGKLYDRINKAFADHRITKEMADWAHEVRLDANDQRHADEGAGLPSAEDARRAIAFATALGQFLFVLPAQVKRGREEANKA